MATRQDYRIFASLDASPPESGGLEQFTPDQADWSTLTELAIGHDPDSIPSIPRMSWVDARWDGNPFNPETMTREELANAICPSWDTVRGIRELFYEHRPFADNVRPTKAEVDEWHRLALTHIRRLVGYGSEYDAVKDHCLFSRALWGNQRKNSDVWDAEYPGEISERFSAPGNPCFGPCPHPDGSCAGHCGSLFLPDAEDQAPYLPPGSPDRCGTAAGAEGIFSASKSRIPWAVKWSRAMCQTLSHEGFWGGHTGPWFHRQKFGFDFWDSDPDNSESNAILRAKWSGALFDSQYTCNPAIHQCR